MPLPMTSSRPNYLSKASHPSTTKSGGQGFNTGIWGWGWGGKASTGFHDRWLAWSFLPVRNGFSQWFKSGNLFKIRSPAEPLRAYSQSHPYLLKQDFCLSHVIGHCVSFFNSDRLPLWEPGKVPPMIHCFLDLCKCSVQWSQAPDCSLCVLSLSRGS